MSKWVDFVEQPRDWKRKTLIWEVRSREGDGLIGLISWYGSWRCYAFHPYADTVFEKVCLRDIAKFCEFQTDNHMAYRRAKKRADAGPVHV